MSDPFDKDTKYAIRAALARDAYERNVVRLVDPDIAGHDWLVASPQGVFAVAKARFKTVIQGWFFGIHRAGGEIYLFENCGLRNDAVARGRIVRLALADGRLSDPAVLAVGLHNNCHQLALIAGLICVVDTANQAIRRFAPDGAAVDTQQVFPPAPPSDTSGAYLHINSIASVGNRTAILLHNGKTIPETCSELACFDRDWTLLSREALAGRSCHDIVEDERGVLWHSDSMAGDIVSSDGRRVKVTGELMTRGIAFRPGGAIVGMSTFGPRHLRDTLRGAVVIFDRRLRRQAEVELPGAPTDIVSI